VLPRRLVTSLVVIALLAVATTADASVCNANCALAALGRSHDQHLHHPQSSALTAAQHHHHDGLSSHARESRSLLAFRSPKCGVYSQFLALTSASKFSLTKSAFSAERVAVDGTIVSAPDLSPQDLSLPCWVHSPPGSTQPSVVAPLRI